MGVLQPESLRGGTHLAPPPRVAWGVEKTRRTVQPVRAMTRRKAAAGTAHSPGALAAISIACGQRGWKWHPVGGASGEGSSPAIGLSSGPRLPPRLRRGTLSSRARV